MYHPPTRLDLHSHFNFAHVVVTEQYITLSLTHTTNRPNNPGAMKFCMNET